MATVEQLTIEFTGKGAPKLTGQLNALSAAMNRLAGKQAKVSKQTKRGSKEIDSYNERMTKTGRNVSGITGVFGKFGKRMSQMRSQILIVSFAIGLFTKTVKALADAFAEYAKLNFKVNAILKSTGKTVGFTAKQLDNMANSMENTMEVSSTAVKEMQVRLLTFTNIVGTTFEQAQIAAADMAAVFGQDLSQATIQLGKALNDPMKGYTALRRIGVSFSAQQVKLIKQFQEQGDIMGAQKVILDELNREFGGASKAMTKAAIGAEQWRKFSNEAAKAARGLGKALQPLIAGLGAVSRGLLKWVSIVPNAIVKTGKLYFSYLRLVAGLKTVDAEFATAARHEDFANQMTAMRASLNSLTGVFRTSAEEATGFTKAFSKIADERTLSQITNEIDELTESHSHYNNNTKAINDLNKEFAERMLRNTQIMEFQRAKQDTLQGSVLTYTDSLKKSMTVQMLQMEANPKMIKGTDVMHLKLNKLTEVQKLNLRIQTDLKGMTDEQIAKAMEYAQAIDATNASLEEVNKTMAIQAAKKELVVEAFNVMMEASSSYMDSIRASAQERIDLIQLEIDEIHRRRDEELDSLRESTAYKLSSDKKKKDMEQKVVDDHLKLENERKIAEKKIRDDAIEDMKKLFRFEQAINIAESYMNTSQAYTKALAQGGFLLGIPMATAVAVLGAAQIAMIAAQQPPSFQYGCLVGGEPHSRGGTMIEAERGEFVMSRRAVDALGVETMNRINRGGGTSSVNISFSGNVLSKDFIEDEAIPQIKEAIRRGADIGIG